MAALTHQLWLPPARLNVWRDGVGEVAGQPLGYLPPSARLNVWRDRRRYRIRPCPLKTTKSLRKATPRKTVTPLKTPKVVEGPVHWTKDRLRTPIHSPHRLRTPIHGPHRLRTPIHNLHQLRTPIHNRQNPSQQRQNLSPLSLCAEWGRGALR